MHTIALSQKRTENKQLPCGRAFLSMRKTQLLRIDKVLQSILVRFPTIQHGQSGTILFIKIKNEFKIISI